MKLFTLPALTLLILGCSSRSFVADPCTHSDSCQLFGLCSTVDDECVAVKDEHCTHSDWCQLFDMCLMIDGRCIATKNEECVRSEICKREGRCILVDGQCKAVNNIDCKRSEGCMIYGNCSASTNGFCLPNKDEHCKNSVQCREGGQCVLFDHAKEGSQEGYIGEYVYETEELLPQQQRICIKR